MSIFCKIQPSDELSDVIECIWILDTDKCSQVFNEHEILLPDSCAELIFNYSDPYQKRVINGTRESLIQGLYITGPHSSGYQIKHGNRIKMIGVRFKPWGFSFLFNESAKDYDHRSIPLFEIMPEARGLETMLLLSQDNMHRVSILQEFLGSLKRKSKKTSAAIIPEVYNEITEGNSNVRLIQYYKEKGIDARTIERKFLKYIGLSPKQIIRINRFNYFIRQHFTSDVNSFDAPSYGYYDASHLSKEFKFFIGNSPGKFFRQEHQLLQIFAA